MEYAAHREWKRSRAPRAFLWLSVVLLALWIADRPGLAGGMPFSFDSRSLAIEPPTAETVFWCRAVADEDGLPIVGATFSAHREGPPFANSSHLADLSRTESNSDGVVELQMTDLHPVLVRVDARGFGPVVFRTAMGHETQDRPLVVRLKRSATLVVRIVNRSPVPISGARVELGTGTLTVAAPGSSLFDGFSWGHGLRWEGLTGGDGVCVIQDLPPGVRLSARAVWGRDVLRKSPTGIVLEPGECRELVWWIGYGTRLAGRMMDQHGEPVKNRWLWLTGNERQTTSRRERIYYRSYGYDDVVDGTRTDEAGRFAFEDVPPGRWFVGPSPGDEDRLEPDPKAVAAVATAVTVLAGSTRTEVELRVHRGLYVQGRIALPRTAEAPRVRVNASSELGGVEASVEGDRFLLGPLEPVAHHLVASAYGNFTDSPKLEAWPPAENLLLELGRGGSLSGHVVDALSGERCEAKIHAAGLELGHRRGASGLRDEFTLEGLPPGTYHLVARASGDRVGVLAAIELERGGAVEGLEVRVDRGGRLRIRCEGAGDRGKYRLYTGGDLLGFGFLRSSTVEELLPAGEILVQVLRGDDPIGQREVRCLVGEEVDAVIEID